MVFRESFISKESGFADAVERFFSSTAVSVAAFYLILLYGALLRLAYRLLSDGYRLRDEITYLKRIAMAADAGLQSSTSSNLLIFLGTLFYRNPDQTELLLRGINFAASVALMIVVYFIAKEVFESRGAGLLAMLCTAAVPDLIRISSSMLREPLYLLIFAFLMLQCVRYWKSPARMRPAFCALLAVLGLWARYEGLELFFFFPLTILCGVGFRRIPRRTAAADLLTFLFAAFFGYALLLFLLPVYYHKIWLKFTESLPG